MTVGFCGRVLGLEEERETKKVDVFGESSGALRVREFDELSARRTSQSGFGKGGRVEEMEVCKAALACGMAAWEYAWDSGVVVGL